MPELPDLEIIREVLSPRLENVTITAVDVRRPIVVRNLLGYVGGWSPLWGWIPRRYPPFAGKLQQQVLLGRPISIVRARLWFQVPKRPVN